MRHATVMATNAQVATLNEGAAPIPLPPYVRIRHAAKLVGVPSSVLRHWEQEFGFNAERTRSGERLYTAAQVVEFRAIKELTREWGFSLRGARKQLAKARGK